MIKNQINKHIVLSRDTTSTRAQCPLCLSNQSTKRCKIFKNPSALWHHLKRDHTEYDFTSFVNSVKKMNVILENLSIAQNLGMFQ